MLRTVGGPWHEFEVEGINYGPTEDTYTRQQKERRAHDRENSIGLGGMADRAFAQGQAGGDELSSGLADGRPIDGGNGARRADRATGAGWRRVIVDGTIYEVTFAIEGPPGGRIRISQTDKVVVERALAAGVEDNYRKWSDDPRYKAWMTRPEYKNFIGAREVDGYRP